MENGSYSSQILLIRGIRTATDNRSSESVCTGAAAMIWPSLMDLCGVSAPVNKYMKIPVHKLDDYQMPAFRTDWANIFKIRQWKDWWLLALSLSLSGTCHEDVAASTSRRHAGLSIVCHIAIARPKLSGRRSSSIVLSQVCLGLPVLCRQSLGGPRMQAQRAREWSNDRCRHGTDDQRRTSAVDG